MALSIKSDEADRLARELADVTGESLTDTVTTALRERLARTRSGRQRSMRDALQQILEEARLVDDMGERTVAELVPYDDHGVPE